MEEILRSIEFIEDIRQQAKVRHKLLDIVVIVLFAKLANADDWEEIEMFAECHTDFLRRYVKLENGVPSHDTITLAVKYRNLYYDLIVVSGIIDTWKI